MNQPVRDLVADLKSGDGRVFFYLADAAMGVAAPGAGAATAGFSSPLRS